MPRTVLFDLDGTLTDPKPGITGCIAYALEELGLMPPASDELTWCIGPPLAGSFCQLVGTQDPETVDRAMELYRKRFSTVGLYENALYPDIPRVLTELKRRGLRLFVATSKPHIYAKRIVEHFGIAEFFESVYGCELDGTRTDKGELIAHLLVREAISPEEAVMIGDREHDMIGAVRNGMEGIGVLYGYGTREELLAAGASKICETAASIPDNL